MESSNNFSGEGDPSDSKKHEEGKNASLEEGRMYFGARGEINDERGGEVGREKEPGLVEEVKAQFHLAWPMTISNLLSFSLVVVAVMFVGHLGELELSSASVANSFATVTGISVMIGLSSALETICGQAYGAKTYHLMGVYLQSSLIINFAVCIPITILWLNMEKVLVAVGQDPQISRLAASYLHYLIPALFSTALSQPLNRFLQTQSLVLPLMLSALAVALLHPFVCYLVIHTLQFGYHGGAIATTVSYWILALLLVLYTTFGAKCEASWAGWAIWEALGAAKLYVKLAVPSAVMACLEFWSFEILVLLSGLLPRPSLELSLLSVSLNTATLTFMIPFGLGVAASTRVSNELGANHPWAAKLAVKVVLGLAALEAGVISIIMVVIRDLWGRAFTDAKEVLEYVAQVIPLLAILSFMNSIQGVLSGVARGCGRQVLGAFINLGAFYILGIPMALFLGFRLHFNGMGLVLGLTCGIFTQMTFLLFYILRTNWERMADKAQDRIHQQPLENEPLLPNSLKSCQENTSAGKALTK